MKLIEVTGEKRKVYVNVDSIVTIESMEWEDKVHHSFLILTGDRRLPVREKVDQILAKLPEGSL